MIGPQVSTTFFDENDKKITTIEDKVYPITEEKDAILKTSAQHHLEKLTSYYDAETREIKNQSNIIFTMKIVNPKLDEIAKDQHEESGNEDSYVEKEEDEKLQILKKCENQNFYSMSGKFLEGFINNFKIRNV